MSMLYCPTITDPRLRAIKEEYDRLLDAVTLWEKDLKHAMQHQKETPARIIKHLQAIMIDLDTERQEIYLKSIDK